MKNKRGEGEGKAIASLIMVIALAIALYVLLIPPEERQALIEGETTEETTRTSETIELLSESPGELSPRQETGTIHSINAINLFIKTEPEVVQLAEDLEVKHTLFTKSSPTVSFETKNRDDLKKASFYFSVQEPRGTLKLKINNNNFYAKKMETGGIKIIDIPATYLKDVNEVEITTSSPGLAFWRTNEYNLKDVGVRLEYEHINAKETRTFSMTQQELDKIKETKLTYVQVCNAPLEQDTTQLRIILNDQELVENYIRCVTTPQTIELEKSDLKEGQNTITFIINDGEFAFNQIRIETKSEDITYPTFFFTINQENFEKIQTNKKDAIMKIYLQDDDKDKNARLNINDETIFMKTTESKAEYDISDYLEQGTNFIRIQPTTTYSMVGLKVTLE